MSAPTPKRFIASVLAMGLALGAAVALPLTAPAHACACGAFAPPNDADGPVTLNSESAIVSWIDGRERIDLRLALDSVSTQTGLIVPTPTPATVSSGALSDFTALEAEMTPQRISKDVWWSTAGNGVGGALGAVPPTVLDQVRLGNLEATTLAAEDADGLTGWLGANGYGLASEVTDRLGHYVDRGWAFVAIKLIGDKALTGDLAPIRFEFASDSFVYPLFLSQAASSAQTVRLYILADHRQTVSFADGSPTGAVVDWARFVRDVTMQKRGMYLTAVTMFFPDPAGSISDDLVITRAATDEEVGTVVVNYNYMALLGVPLGWLLVGFAVVVFGVILMLTISPRRWG